MNKMDKISFLRVSCRGGESAVHNHNWKFSTRNGKYKCIHCGKLAGDKRNMVP